MKVIIENDHIDDYAAEGEEFFRNILQMDYDDVLVTDLSQLSDFEFRGFPEGTFDFTKPLKALSKQWDQAILARIKDVYGVELPRTNYTLIVLFEMLRARNARKTLH